MDVSNFVLLIVGLAALIIVIISFFAARRGYGAEEQKKRFNELQQQFVNHLMNQTSVLAETIGKVREDSTEAIGKSFQSTQKNLAESLAKGREEVELKLQQLIKETADMRSSSEKMMEIGRDIRQLSEILEGPKSRGVFGEFQLELLLKDAIPADKFKLQYKIGEGVVDAAVLLKDRTLCIDSKFPKDNLIKANEAEAGSKEKEDFIKQFKSDVRKHAKSIGKKYIIPQKTLDFAIMFIPSEQVFQEITADSAFHKELMDMNIVSASPNFLYIYLQSLAIGFRGMAVEARAGEIIHAISELKVRFDKFGETYRLAGKHMENATKQYFESEKLMDKLEHTLDDLKMGGTGNP